MQKEYTNKSEQMRIHINQCQSSGQRVADYCKEHSLSKATYYNWHKKLSAPSTSGGFIELPSTNINSCVEVVLGNGVSIHFNQLIPSTYLKDLLCCI
jgi:hypothetical protein